MASRDELQHLVDEISSVLGAPATLESPDFDLIAFRAISFRAHDTDAAELDSVRMRSILGRGSTTETRVWFESFGIASATGPVRTPAEPSLGILTRLCLPVRREGALLGYVWLLDDGREPEPAALTEAVKLTERIGEVLLAQDEAADDLGDVLAAALTARGATRADALQVLGDHFGGSAAVVVVGGDSTATISGVVGTVVDRVAVALVPLADVADDRPARRVAGTGGIGAPFTDITDIAGLTESYRQAAFAHRVSPRAAQRWEDLGFYRLLIDVRRSDPAVSGLIEALVGLPDLLYTAEVFLDHAGNVQAAAAELHIHRQTLYYRLTKIESATGLDLASGTDRLLLHLAVKLARV